jgi:flagellar basal body rod protein FlgC
MSAVTTATSGLYAATQQLTVAASNLANSQSSGTVSTDPSSLGSSALGSSALGASAAAASNAAAPTGSNVAPPLAYQPLQLVQYSNADIAGGGVSTTIQPAPPSAYAAYAPSAAYASASGQTASPDIDLPSQIANQAGALIQFQANLKTIQASDQLQESVINQRA